MKKKELKDGTLYEYRYRYKSRRSAAWFYCVLALIVVAALGFRVWFTDSFGGVEVDGLSMWPTLRDEERLLMKYGGEDAERGDVIVVDVRKYGFYDSERKPLQFLIKRLIGVAGDKVKCEDSQVYICYAGTDEYVALYEPYANPGGGYEFSEYVVGEGEIFFLGDNRTNSIDSRYLDRLSHLDGLYKVSDIYGVVPDWAIKYQNILQYIPGLRIDYD